MWVSLFIALVTYLLSDTSTADKRKNALLSAAAIGGVSYVAATNTDWGKDISGKFDSFVGLNGEPLTASPNTAATAANAGNALQTGATGTGTATSTGGLWSTLTSWGAAGTAAVVGTGAAGAALVSGKTNWLVIAAIAGGAYLLLK